jgi:cytochrome c2
MNPTKRGPATRLVLSLGLAAGVLPILTASTQGAADASDAAEPDRIHLAQGTAPAEEAAEVSEFAAMVAAADPVAGQQFASLSCVACHTVGEGEGVRVGPNLYNVVGRPVAAVEGYAYSAAMAAVGTDGGIWTADLLGALLESPQMAIPGTIMPFGGIADAATRANVVAYLATLSPDAATPDGDTGPAEDAPDLTPVSYSLEQAERGHTRFDRECAECHGGDLNGGLNGGPPLRGLAFEAKYANGAPASILYLFMSTNMPPESPGRFSATAYADVMAYLLQLLGFEAGEPLPADIEALSLLSVER